MLTFGPMIDSELSRLLMRHYGHPFREARHIFGWASLLALTRGGTGQIPLLLGDKIRLTGPRALIDHDEQQCAQDKILIPARQPLRAQVEADWRRFNGELATYTARIAYHHLLPHRELMLEPFTRGVPPVEARLTPSLYPLLRRLFSVLLRLNPGSVADALEHTRRIVAGVDARLVDGRRFLWGDTLTLSDLAFATALAPLVLPLGYTAPVSPLNVWPEALRHVLDALRHHPSAGLVGRVYARYTRLDA